MIALAEGRADSAVAYFRRSDSEADGLRTANCTTAGDTPHATEYDGRFVDLWKNADADLQPRVTEARERMVKLNRSKL